MVSYCYKCSPEEYLIAVISICVYEQFEVSLLNYCKMLLNIHYASIYERFIFVRKVVENRSNHKEKIFEYKFEIFFC